MTKKQTFEIDFFELSILAEAYIPPVPIAMGCFWDKMIDEYYHLLTPDERIKIHKWMQRNFRYEEGLQNNYDVQLFEARYNPNSQWKVTVDYEGEKKVVDCFLFEGRFYTKRNYSLIEKYIIKKEKI